MSLYYKGIHDFLFILKGHFGIIKERTFWNIKRTHFGILKEHFGILKDNLEY